MPTPTRPAARLGPAALVLLTAAFAGPALLWSSGCESSSGTRAETPAVDYELLYTKGDYAKAHQAASSAYAKSTGVLRERAALTAGLSVAAMQPPKEAEAQRWLRPLVTSENAAIAGSAAATLGMMAQRSGKHTEAVTLLTSASDKLSGNDQARAKMFAGDSLQALGKGPESREMYAQAAAVATESLLKVQITSRQNTLPEAGPVKGSFTIQVGAFSDPKKAKAAADRLAGKTAAAGIPAPRVVQTSSKNGTVHAVRIGRFATRAEAQAAQQKLTGESTAMVMVATGE